MSVALPFGRPARRSRYRLRRFLTEATSVILGVVLLVWSLTPVYNMLLIALDAEGDNEFAGYIWPPGALQDHRRAPLVGTFVRQGIGADDVSGRSAVAGTGRTGRGAGARACGPQRNGVRRVPSSRQSARRSSIKHKADQGWKASERGIETDTPGAPVQIRGLFGGVSAEPNPGPHQRPETPGSVISNDRR